MVNKRVLLVAAGILILFAVLSIYSRPIQIVEYDIIFQVGELKSVGVDVGTDALRFGTIPPGSRGSRDIIIQNSENNAVVHLEVIGEVKDWIIFSENDFLLAPYENKTVAVYAKIPNQAEKAKYNNTLRISFNRPRLF